MQGFDLSNPQISNDKALNNIRKYKEDNPLVERIRFEEFYRIRGINIIPGEQHAKDIDNILFKNWKYGEDGKPHM